MRPYLFRGKALEGEWKFGSLVVLSDEAIIINETGQTKVDPKTVGEWTGLFDRESNRIFEGDIITACEWFIAPYRCVIEFRNGSFVGISSERTGGGNTYPSITQWSEFYSVIGNIHDKR